jgi:serine/threonine-protein kinase
MTTETLERPRTLGRYELVHLLGQGGMGEVWLAKISGAAGFEKPCIVKTILPALLKDRQFLDRFHHEAKVLVHLVHSSIAQVYDMGEAEGTCYIALEYVAGVDLAYLEEQARGRGELLPVPVVLYLGQRMVEGLGYAHRKAGPDGAPLGIVHRDVSPHNVMVSYEGEVKVIDFGLAKSAARSKYTLPATVMGKLGYMSPEQARAEPVDHRSDLYSCGVVVWELLAGRPLVAHGTVGEMMAAMANPVVPALHELRPDVSPELDAVVRRALAPRPEERYARADDFARALAEQFIRSGATLGGEEVGAYVRTLCPEAFAAQRRLISKISSPGMRRASEPPVPGALANTGRFSPLPEAPGAAPVSGYEATALRPAGGVAVPGSRTAETLTGHEATALRPVSEPSVPQAQAGAPLPPVPVPPAAPVSGPAPVPVPASGARLRPVVLGLAVFGLVALTALATVAVMWNRMPPPPHLAAGGEGEPGWRPPRERPPRHEGRPHDGPPRHEGRPPHDGPPHDGRQPRGEDPRMAGGHDRPPPPPPEARPPPEPPPGERPPSVVPVAGSAGEGAEAPSKPRKAAPLVAVPAKLVAGMFKDGAEHFVRGGATKGLEMGAVLAVVGPPQKGGKRKRLGEATVVEVWPTLARVSLDENAKAASGKRFAVLPEAPAKPPEPQVAAPAPAEPVPAPVSTPAVEEKKPLVGSATFAGIGPFRSITLVNKDKRTWNGCTIALSGRLAYDFGALAPGGKRAALVRDFKINAKVDYLKKGLMRVTCEEGERDFAVPD